MAVSSAIEQLERARELCRFACFQEAARDFDELARSALPAAPDVWIEATFGLAECFRLRHDYARASAQYQAVLQRYCQAPSLSNGSRLVESNRYSVAQSFLSLATISRLSLRVPAAELRELMAEGALWAQRELGSGPIDAAFRLSELLFERNTRGPLATAERFRGLLRDIERQNHGDGPADAVVVGVRLGETLLDAGQTGYQPKVASEQHWAYRWSKVNCDLLRAREELLKGNMKRARRILAESVNPNPAVECFLELKPLAAALTAESANREEFPGALLAYRESIRAIEELSSGEEMRNVSEPLWHLANLIQLQIDPAFEQLNRKGPKEKPGDLLRDVFTLSQYLEPAWLRETLASRGMTPVDVDEMTTWCERRDYGSSWISDGLHLLGRLRKVVRP